jgi:hypothetical protein
MGYPHERNAVLDADHRRVCKYESPSDPNYIAVRDVLQSITDNILRRGKLLQFSIENRTNLTKRSSVFIERPKDLARDAAD